MSARFILALVAAVAAVSAVAAVHPADQPWDGGARPFRRVYRAPAAARASPAAASAAAAAAAASQTCVDPPQRQPLPEKLPASLETALARVATRFEGACRAAGAAGGTLAVTYGNRTLLTHSYGNTSRDDGTSRPVDSDTLFRLGSVSKLLPSLLLQRMAEDGVVSPDEPLSRIVPAYAPRWAGRTRFGATLRDLASHTAGLPRYAPCVFGATCAALDLDEAVRLVNEWYLLSAPGDRVAYSNAGFSLLGHALARAANGTYNDKVDSLLAAMGMTRSRAGGPPPADDPNVASGYTSRDPRAPPIGPYDLGFSDPAGGAWSTGADMARFLQHLAADTRARSDDGGSVPLDGTTLRRWLRHRVMVDPRAGQEDRTVMATGWGSPWEVLTVLDSTSPSFSQFEMPTKDGSVPGYRTQLAVVPDLGVGLFAAMSTGQGGDNSDFYASAVVSAGFGVVPAVVEALQAQGAPPVSAPVPVAPAASVPGAYDVKDASGGVVARFALAARAGGGLVARPDATHGGGIANGTLLTRLDERAYAMLSPQGRTCYETQNGDNYVFAFSKDGGSLEVQGTSGGTVKAVRA